MRNNLSDLEIEKLTKTLVSKNKRVVALYGVPENTSYKLMNDLISLMDVEIPNWSSISSATEDQCINDIKNFLLSNASLENFKNLPSNNPLINWWKRRRLNTVVKKIEEINSAFADREITSRSKIFLMPVLTAFSTLGTTLAVPLISVTFLRGDAIINLWGKDGYIAFLSLLFSLVVAVIISAFVALFSSLKNNKRNYIVSNMTEGLKRIYDKYFIESNSQEKINAKVTFYSRFLERSKFVVQNNYTFFYDVVDINSDQYPKILKYFKTLNQLNNTVIFDASGFKYLDERKIFRNIIDLEKTNVVRLDRYKTKTSGRRLMSFIFYQLSIIANVNTRKLLQKFPFFVNSLYRFLDYSEKNTELLTLLLDIKKHASKTEIPLNDESQLFFVDFFTFVVFKALDELGFETLMNDLTVYGRPSEITKKNITYNSLKLDYIINRNARNFGQQALLFNLLDYFDETVNKNIFNELGNSNKNMIFSKNHQLNLANEALSKKGFTKREIDLNNHWYDALYSNLHDDEDMFVKIIEIKDNVDILNVLDEVFVRAQNDGVKNLLIYVFNVKMLYSLIDNEYELVNESII
ncbi:hypothetical protein [Ureaplasma parvum]|uniref:Uncharacterized protein n=1 Tax=Ureaplasma parvum TaxID=134821 RepID=A0AAC9T0L3_UREPR|nr:hypothetical protein [Ureaplasma parvum]ASD24667.1 hypothetical protein CEG38_01995 [Ureaplasma parvum]ASD25061.1 hypothetical protein CEE64_01130 [Ureaplasma parvum]ASD29311.1 hypothetical protein CEG41_01295 [Ureaplasma parvum]ASD29701.1 hypothetical protein CEG42_00335 [Ureaplasma parvum]EDT49136.1 conserved hypothetical protein [Ureaplasma parvum serovar 1 str. ATCC 27813]